MTTALSSLSDQLVESLRTELQDYGELLARLDQQQESVLGRAADDVLHTVGGIQEQMAQAQSTRRVREEQQAQLAEMLQQPRDTSFSNLLPVLSEKYRFTIEALVRENNELLVRVQQRARQNHLLLSRSMELMQQFISAFVPVEKPKIYNPGGQLATAETSGHTLYEAVG